jgi:hypothetical protein
VEKELGYQTPKKDLKGLYAQSDSESGGEERSKKLYVMYGQLGVRLLTSRLFAGKFSR